MKIIKNLIKMVKLQNILMCALDININNQGTEA